MKPKSFKDPIYVTRPLLPPLNEYLAELQPVWESQWLTNGGAKHRELEHTLATYLNAPNVSLFNNGTTALIVASHALGLSGEVITTPFTFPATPHVLSWNGITPVFADIHPETLTLDSQCVAPLVTARTTGILGVHVYGMPCAVEEIQRIADDYGLRVVYDGAHTFGTKIGTRPITDYGDATMLSFHATKLFHTAEGGALVVRDADIKQRIDLLKNFGIRSETEVTMPGLNGKMNELQAALGIATLRHLDGERQARIKVAKVYTSRLDLLEGVRCLRLPPNVTDSLQYFVIRVDAQRAAISRDALTLALREYNIFVRKYFYPLCSDYSCYRSLPSASPSALPVAHRVAGEVLCLPFYGVLGTGGAHRICDVIEHVMQRPSQRTRASKRKLA